MALAAADRSNDVPISRLGVAAELARRSTSSMEHHDARDDFDHSAVDDRNPTTVGSGSESSGFSTATGGGTSTEARPFPHASTETDAGAAGSEVESGADHVDAPLEQGTDPQVVGDRDEPDLPVRTNTEQPESAGSLPHESDIEQRLAAAARAPHRDAGEPDAALGR